MESKQMQERSQPVLQGLLGLGGPLELSQWRQGAQAFGPLPRAVSRQSTWRGVCPWVRHSLQPGLMSRGTGSGLSGGNGTERGCAQGVHRSVLFSALGRAVHGQHGWLCVSSGQMAL